MGILLLSSLLLCWLVCFWLDSTPAMILATAAGSMLAWLFVGSGFISFYVARLKQVRTFQRIFLGSIFGRLTVMVAVLLLILKCTDLQRLPFLISLLCGYFIFQMWEVLSFNRLATKEL
jgi:hypothetical protein